MSIKYRIKKGDEVLVIAGKDKGKKGNIISVDKKNSRVIVEGVNISKKHIKNTSKILEFISKILLNGTNLVLKKSNLKDNQKEKAIVIIRL